MRPSSAWLLASSLMVAGLSSCGEGPGSSGSAMSDGAVAGGAEPGATVPESVPAYPFRIVNPRVYTVVVFASAGAGARLFAADGVRLEPEQLRFDADQGELMPREPMRRRSLRLILSDFLTPADPGPDSAPRCCIRWSCSIAPTRRLRRLGPGTRPTRRASRRG